MEVPTRQFIGIQLQTNLSSSDRLPWHHWYKVHVWHVTVHYFHKMIWHYVASCCHCVFKSSVLIMILQTPFIVACLSNKIAGCRLKVMLFVAAFYDFSSAKLKYWLTMIEDLCYLNLVVTALQHRNWFIVWCCVCMTSILNFFFKCNCFLGCCKIFMVADWMKAIFRDASKGSWKTA